MPGRGRGPSNRRSSRERCRRGAPTRTIGKFANDPSLTDAEIATITAWVDGGAPEGNRTDLPKVPTFTEGWAMGKPDLIFEMVEPFQIPADGTVPYTYVTIPTHLDHDIWISGRRIQPADRASCITSSATSSKAAAGRRRSRA